MGDLLKISLGPPFALFNKMRVLGDLAKIAITRATVWAIFETFPLVPAMHFLRKCWFWVTLRKLP